LDGGFGAHLGIGPFVFEGIIHHHRIHEDIAFVRIVVMAFYGLGCIATHRPSKRDPGGLIADLYEEQDSETGSEIRSE